MMHSETKILVGALDAALTTRCDLFSLDDGGNVYFLETLVRHDIVEQLYAPDLADMLDGIAAAAQAKAAALRSTSTDG